MQRPHKAPETVLVVRLRFKILNQSPGEEGCHGRGNTFQTHAPAPPHTNTGAIHFNYRGAPSREEGEAADWDKVVEKTPGG